MRLGPRYCINYEALRYIKNPMPVVDHLLDRIASRYWVREYLCRECEDWKPEHGLSTYPRRPGAADNVGEHGGCSGCWYSHLDRTAAAEPPPRKELAMRLRVITQVLHGQQIQFEMKPPARSPRQPPPSRFPILGSTPHVSVAWSIVAPHAHRATLNHGQTLETLARRGGLHYAEFWCLIYEKPWVAYHRAHGVPQLRKLGMSLVSQILSDLPARAAQEPVSALAGSLAPTTSARDGRTP